MPMMYTILALLRVLDIAGANIYSIASNSKMTSRAMKIVSVVASMSIISIPITIIRNTNVKNLKNDPKKGLRGSSIPKYYLPLIFFELDSCIFDINLYLLSLYTSTG